MTPTTSCITWRSRKSDTQALRRSLRRLGLYSLAHAEHNVLGILNAVHHALGRLTDEVQHDANLLERALTETLARRRSSQTRHPWPQSPRGRAVSIMVTLPTEAADNPDLVAEMIAAGMNVARVNCAHDNADVWERMIANVRSGAKEAGTDCRVMMDLAGPKLRTGELKPGPARDAHSPQT